MPIGEALTKQDEVELEIGAFMGPHIKRARIVLAVVGALYFISGWLQYSSVADARTMLGQLSDSGHGPELEHARHLVSVAYVIVVSSMIAGLANVVLAAIAGKKMMGAFYAAVGIFVVLSLIEAFLSHGLVFTDWLWWLTTIAVWLGFQAALKAHKLRGTNAAKPS